MSPGAAFQVIGASAGTGKTHRLTELVLAALGVGPHAAAAPIPPEALVGVTFTRKAAHELAERLRTRLYAPAAASAELAQRLPMAYLGTTHAVGLRLLAEYAVEAGTSPEVGVLPEDGGRFLHALLETVLDDDAQRHLDALAWRLRVRWDARDRKADWAADVFELVDLARANRIAGDALPAMAERSWATLRAHLDPPDDARDLDAEVRAALVAAPVEAAAAGDGTKVTAAFLARIAELASELEAGVWAPYAVLTNVSLGARSSALEVRLNTLGAAVLGHPRLHADLRAYLDAVAAAAATVLGAFQAWKAAAHVVDHTDQLDLALRLLDVPAVADELSAALRLVVVDELQDSSPLQVALHLRLHALAGRSVWVGDPKQCIFEWNGADPSLVDVVLAELAADVGAGAAGATERLATNRRSRPELVALTSELFASAFLDHGLVPGDVRVTPYRVDPPELAALPPVGLVELPPQDPDGGLAAAVAGLLAAAAATPVVDRDSDEVRAVRPGDVAILVPTNDAAVRVATALQALGVPVATAARGLLDTPEGVAVSAALSLLVAPDDALAEAELESLLGREGDADAVVAARDAWVTARLQALRSRAEGAGGAVAAPWSERLAHVRRALAALSPGAALERVVEVLDLPRRALGWPEPARRVANLDALRRIAREYEALEAARRRAPTLPGLLRTFAAIRARAADMPLDDAQHVSASADAVQVLTYHKAKGLEWPVVVLAGLDKSSRRSAFAVACESDAAAFSLAAPLASRWLRHWPWPFAPSRNHPLEARVAASELGRAVARREARERVRLLYVGFTRARDHLVVALEPPNKRGERKMAWLDELQRDGAPLWRIDERGLAVERPDRTWLACRTRFIEAQATRPETPLSGAAQHAPATAPARPSSPPARPRRHVSPSRADAASLARLGVPPWEPRGPIIRLGPPLTVAVPSGFVDWDRLGTAVHGFLASDGPERDFDRGIRAQRWCSAHGTAAEVTAAALLAAGDRWRRFLGERFPGMAVAREIALVSEISDGGLPRRNRGVIDALLTGERGFVVLDHKSFPAPEAAWKKAEAFAPQLALYAHMLASLGAESGDSQPIAGAFVHFPFAGVVVELVRSRPRG